MEQNELEKTRNSINVKAAKIREDDLANGAWLFGGLFLVFEALNYFFDWFPHHLAICVTVVVFAALIAVSRAINNVLLDRMTSAVGVQQHYQAARRFIRWNQLTHILSFAMAFLFVNAVFDGFEWPHSIVPPLAIIAVELLILLFKHDAFIDSDFYDEVEELKEEI